ncbi:MAG: GNAT family N-acetyltransferase [Austwickia sp.]|nr:GNAT family N-acetyltransferase [Actinomycetota bacterium]MCB1254707.1 GNAT family N-acetyltransferase [Austwickia sp.]MCO5308540.1 GNAT family N-acetyltransferase [Austwickia sp.]
MALANDVTSHWEADVLLVDGGTARIRPIRGDDGDRLVALFERMSEDSRYMRFFSPKNALTDYEIQRFTGADQNQRVVLVMTLGEDMIGTGGYDRMNDEEAEVAFMVSDDQQGRGVGTLLLEHLAQAGRERGVRRFVAEVLPENGQMLRAFRAAGYQISQGFAQGLMRFEFPIAPTQNSLAVMVSREHRAEARSMQRFFVARSVVVLGASRQRNSMGQRIVHNLVLGGFTGRIYLVHPEADAILGIPAYRSMADISEHVDLAIIAVPADRVNEVALECARHGVHGLVVVSSGFAEAGPEGVERQRQLLDLTRGYGMRLVGPNGLGVINTDPTVSLNATVSPLMPLPGRVGFFSQSGALGMAILRNVSGRGLGLSTFVSAGNRADVSGNDLLQYWEEDDATEVVLLYLESIGNPRKFSRIARRVGRLKPVVAVKSGRADRGAAPTWHRVRRSLAPAAAWAAMFRQAGLIHVDTLDEMFDVAQLLAHQPLPEGPRVALIGNSGEVVNLAADALVGTRLVVERTELLPVSPTGAQMEAALRAAMATPTVDAVFAVYSPPLEERDESVAEAMAAVGRECRKPLLTTFHAERGVPEALRVVDASGGTGRGSVPSYPAPESAARALARVVKYAEWLGRPITPVPVLADVDPDAARAFVEAWLVEHPDGGTFDDAATTGLLATFGIHLSRTRPVHTLEEARSVAAEMAGPLVLKSTDVQLRRHPFVRHLRTGLSGPDEVAAAWRSLTEDLGTAATTTYVLQEQVGPGLPMSLATTEDPSFGPIVSLGPSGPASELLGDIGYGIPPLTEFDAHDMVRGLGSAPLLLGYGGSPALNVPALEDLLHRLGQLNEALAELTHLELAVIVGVERVAVLWAAAHVAPPAQDRADGPTRRLWVPEPDLDAQERSEP